MMMGEELGDDSIYVQQSTSETYIQIPPFPLEEQRLSTSLFPFVTPTNINNNKKKFPKLFEFNIADTKWQKTEPLNS